MTSGEETQGTNAAPRYAVIFTTYAWDSFIAAQYARNAARIGNGDMHVVVDECHGPVDVPASCRKTVASEATATALGLRIAYHRALFWHNIDYLYYIFFDQFPDYDYYMFLDYDAFADVDVQRLMADLRHSGVDYVGARVEGRIKDWTFARQHAAMYGPDVLEARISAVTILSRRALAYLFTRRRQMSAAPSPAQQAFWPICEAFVPSELNLGGFVLAPLGDFGDVDRFAWWPPTLDETLTVAGAPSFVHPVLDRQRFIPSMLRHSRTWELMIGRRLWRAMSACRDRRWFAALPVELASRVRRKRRRRDPSAKTVGMRWET